MQLIQIVTLLATVVTAGWFAAFLTQLIKRQQWRSGVKMILAVVIAGLVGLAAAWLSGDVTRFVTVWKSGGVTAEQVLALATLIYTAAQVWYHANFQKSAWAQTIAAVGSKQS
jgi:hypothetical protein